MTNYLTRRGLLSKAAIASGIGGIAGCLGSVRRTKFLFSTFPVGESLAELTNSFIEADPTQITSHFSIDYPASYKRKIVATLIEEKTVDVVEWQLAYDRSFGTTTHPEPQFIERDGTYYSVTETGRTESTETRWVFYLDLVDETPTSSDTVVTEPPSSLSETDQLLVERALEPVWGHTGAVDVDERPLGGRGPTFHHQMDPDASELVPSAPFDYLNQGDAYFVPRAERGPVQLTRYTFEVEPVASSQAELESYVDSTVVDATFDADNSTDGVISILETATDIGSGRLYKERGSMSDELTTITDRLGMTDNIPTEQSGYVSLNGAVMSFSGTWYRASLSRR
ncbi:hypothetical protein C453_05219 [Haloferax elongans ATCC BAA-1513]|uniref:Uncharacterized protein n=1 Tax=Haloferax elongans ATCC BAA-1513 TaxID=1230453 RepID=M0HVL6_HALEO|nr:hypothetical protein [Haloferax elongans]ELZ87727.1 hypothetical protein C453_05219 [Haloferax elongans ATCC BAA-1513]